MVESLTKQYPTRFMEYLEMKNLKTAPCPRSLRKHRKGVLMIDHIAWEALFYCPSPCGGGLRGRSHLFPPICTFTILQNMEHLVRTAFGDL